MPGLADLIQQIQGAQGQGEQGGDMRLQFLQQALGPMLQGKNPMGQMGGGGPQGRQRPPQQPQFGQMQQQQQAAPPPVELPGPLNPNEATNKRKSLIGGLISAYTGGILLDGESGVGDTPNPQSLMGGPQPLGGLNTLGGSDNIDPRILDLLSIV